MPDSKFLVSVILNLTKKMDSCIKIIKKGGMGNGTHININHRLHNT